MTEAWWTSPKKLYNWNAQERYVELLNFEMKVMNILETKAYLLINEEKVPVIKIWLGQKSLQLIRIFTNEEKEKCKIVKGLFLVLSDKFRLYHNRIELALQFKKTEKSNESTQEWMGRLCTKIAECYYKE